MKRGLLIICFSIAILPLLHAQEVPEVQKSLLTKITATWCPNCGTWGWAFFKNLMEDNSQKAIFVSAHHSGELVSPPGAAFSENFMAPYQPYFYVGNLETGTNNSNFSTKRQEVKNLVDSIFLQSPIVNVGFEASFSDDLLTVNTHTRFFQDATGDYYLGVYILENGVVNYQASIDSMAVHPYVLRAAFTPEAFGDSLASGTITAGTEYTSSVSIQLNANWIADSISVAGIIWNKIEDTYHFINVNTTKDFTFIPTAINIIAEEALAINLFPTIAASVAQLDLNLKVQSQDVNIQLFNINGQVIRQIFQGTLAKGINTLNIPTETLDSGLYFVHIQTADGAVVTKKLIVQ